MQIRGAELTSSSLRDANQRSVTQNCFSKSTDVPLNIFYLIYRVIHITCTFEITFKLRENLMRNCLMQKLHGFKISLFWTMYFFHYKWKEY